MITQVHYFDNVLKYYNINVVNGDKIVCPFHAEDTASLVVDFDKDIYHCFGCEAGGDVIDFISRIDNIDRLKAVSKLSNIMINGKIVIAKNVMFKKFLEKKITTRDYIDLAHDDFNSFEKPDWNYNNYLTKRNLTPEILDNFKVRMDLNSEHKFVIPLYDNNKFRGYIKRCEDSRSGKYLYNKGFERKRFLIGRYGYGVIFVCEGILDYLKAYQFGVRNICCLLGWKASSTHIFILQKYSKELIVALDNDERGGDGTGYLADNFKIKRFVYPKNVKDICEMSKEQFTKSMLKTL